MNRKITLSAIIILAILMGAISVGAKDPQGVPMWERIWKISLQDQPIDVNVMNDPLNVNLDEPIDVELTEPLTVDGEVSLTTDTEVLVKKETLIIKEYYDISSTSPINLEFSVDGYRTVNVYTTVHSGNVDFDYHWVIYDVPTDDFGGTVKKYVGGGPFSPDQIYSYDVRAEAILILMEATTAPAEVSLVIYGIPS